MDEIRIKRPQSWILDCIKTGRDPSKARTTASLVSEMEQNIIEETKNSNELVDN
jgi:hypothetical protein